MEKEAVRKQVHAALEREARIDLHHHRIKIDAADGTVTLEGEVADVAAKKLALELAASVRGALAWWTPGRRDVINALEVRPDYEDRDDEVSEVLRLVLEADPELDAAQINANCSDKVIVLDGSVPSEQQKRRAELDAWSLFAIKGVVNRLQVTR